MKKVINSLGFGIEVETNGQLFGFCVGDIISYILLEKSPWYKRRAVVEGFDMNRLRVDRLWVTVEGETTSRYTSVPDGLILLERPGMLFKVGDKVYISVWNEEGKIVVINPYGSSTPYLVEYATDVAEHHTEPWFPKEYSNLATKKIIWCPEKVLSPFI